MQLTHLQLSAAVGCHKDRAAKWLPHINAALATYGIVTATEIASFLAQISHESNMLSILVENLNYSADGLAATWPSRYKDLATGKPNAKAYLLHRNPMATANDVYANRLGNGSPASNDGWNYRGRAPIQVTGKYNYKLCGAALGVDLVTYPDRLLLPEYGAAAAGWFWHTKGLDRHDDDMQVLAETRIINGGTVGLADRAKKFKIAFAALNGG